METENTYANEPQGMVHVIANARFKDQHILRRNFAFESMSPERTQDHCQGSQGSAQNDPIFHDCSFL